MGGIEFTAVQAEPNAPIGAGAAVAVVIGGVIVFGFLVMPKMHGIRPSEPRDVPTAWRELGEDFLDLATKRPLGNAGFANKATDPPDRNQVAEAPTPADGKFRKCRHCGFQPVAIGVSDCPWCGKGHPNPGVVSRFSGAGGLWGAGIVGIGGAIWGYFSFAGGGGGGAIGGLLLGSLAGVVIGLFAGLIAGFAAKQNGKV